MIKGLSGIKKKVYGTVIIFVIFGGCSYVPIMGIINQDFMIPRGTKLHGVEAIVYASLCLFILVLTAITFLQRLYEGDN